MSDITIENNEFLRQFEVKVSDSLARIEYAEQERKIFLTKIHIPCLLYTSPSPRDYAASRMPSSA